VQRLDQPLLEGTGGVGLAAAQAERVLDLRLVELRGEASELAGDLAGDRPDEPRGARDVENLRG
jgi:hypothetical protein